MYIQYQIYNIFVSIASHNTTIKCIKNRRLYKESTHLHAVHDADLLKKVRNRSDGSDNYTKSLPERVMTRLQAGAFNSLCQHLRVRSETVQNMELMTIIGFCRNCLAKVSMSC